MFKRNSKIILASLAAVFLGLAGYFAVNGFNFYEDRVITLTDKGFKPSEIEIKIGETVTFRNKSSKMFWPASDIHPYHSDYSDFDPERPLERDEEWSFTFERLGQWSFHDHISPNNTGVITVRSADGLSGGACYDLNNGDCWTNMISSTLQASGVDAAFNELKRIHDNSQNKQFVSDCHNYAHDIGLKAYQFFGAEVELSEKTSWCNAGFYHGFMEGFVDDERDPKIIDQFCTRVGKTTNSKFGLAEGHCRHGIGHGSLEALLFDKNFTTEDPIKIVNQSMDLCYATSHNDESVLARCISGVYDTFRNWISDSKAPPTLEFAQTVLDYCVPYDKWYIKFACYQEMSKVIAYLPNPEYRADIFDFKNEIAAQDYEEYGNLVMRTFAIKYGKEAVKEKNYEKLIGFCRTADADLQESCILGIFDGLQFAGTPGEEYRASSRLCGNDLLSTEEQRACFFSFQEEVYYTYPAELWPGICELIPDEFMTERFCVSDVPA